MPKVRSTKKKVAKKKVVTKTSRPTERVRGNRGKSSVSLSKEEEAPFDEINKFSFLLYGEKKIGKTTLCSTFPRATFLFFEAGGKGVTAYKNDVNSWEDAREYLRQLEEDNKKSKPFHGTVIVDTVDIAYRYCYEWVCKKNGVTDPPDNDYGRIWGAIAKEFTRFIERLNSLKAGVFYISHAQFNTITLRDGGSYETLGPTISGQGSRILTGLIDVIAYYGYKGSERILVIKGNDSIEAGHRIEDRFLTKVKRRPVEVISLGDSKEEAGEQVKKGFNNLLLTVGQLPEVVNTNSRLEEK